MIATQRGADQKKSAAPQQSRRPPATDTTNRVEHSNTVRRFPPFARKNAARLRDPNITVWVVVGTGAWSWARERESSHFVVIVCPPGEAPSAFDWRLLSGHDPVLLVRAGVTDGDQVRELVHAILTDGTTRILTTDGTRYVTEGVRDAA